MNMHNKNETDAKQQPGYETRDVNVTAIAKYGMALVVLALVAHLLVWLVFDLFVGEADKRDPVLSPLAPKQLQLPPQPRLQAEVVGDDRNQLPFDSLTLKNQVLQKEEDLLNGYGWIDKNAGIIRIPIDQAMELVVKEQNTHDHK